MELDTSLWLSNEIRVWALGAAAFLSILTAWTRRGALAWLTALMACVGFAATLAASKFQADKDAAVQEQLVDAAAKADAANSAAEAAKAEAGKARADLTKTMMPRLLFPDQVEVIVDKIKKFAGTKFDIAFGQNQEQANIAAWIELALARAKWEQVDWKGPGVIVHRRADRPVAGIVAAEHVVVHFDRERADQLKPAAQALAKALEAEDIRAYATSFPDDPGLDANILHVLIGAKF